MMSSPIKEKQPHKRIPFSLKIQAFSPGLAYLVRGCLFLGCGIPVMGVLSQLALRRIDGVRIAGKFADNKNMNRLTKSAELFERFFFTNEKKSILKGLALFVSVILPLPSLTSVQFWTSPLIIAGALLWTAFVDVPKGLFKGVRRLFGVGKISDKELAQRQQVAREKLDAMVDRERAKQQQQTASEKIMENELNELVQDTASVFNTMTNKAQTTATQSTPENPAPQTQQVQSELPKVEPQPQTQSAISQPEILRTTPSITPMQTHKTQKINEPTPWRNQLLQEVQRVHASELEPMVNRLPEGECAEIVGRYRIYRAQISKQKLPTGRDGTVGGKVINEINREAKKHLCDLIQRKSPAPRNQPRA